MDKLKAFESFVSVASKGSLTAAAKAEGVAPAIMGRRLDSLEAHLGVKLLVRTPRRNPQPHEGTATSVTAWSIWPQKALTVLYVSAIYPIRPWSACVWPTTADCAWPRQNF